METMTLREAACRTGRSTRTLRRLVRTGRLAALRVRGPSGDELLIALADLAKAGLTVKRNTPASPPPVLASRGQKTPAPLEKTTTPSVPATGSGVPLTLYRELLMKHEQLLVQYGMVRVGGARLFEYKADAEAKDRELDRARQILQQEGEKHRQEIHELQAKLRRSELVLQERENAIADLRAKIRTLELLTRNAVTTESIERRYLAVLDQEREVEELLLGAEPSPPQKADFPSPPDRDH